MGNSASPRRDGTANSAAALPACVRQSKNGSALLQLRPAAGSPLASASMLNSRGVRFSPAHRRRSACGERSGGARLDYQL